MIPTPTSACDATFRKQLPTASPFYPMVSCDVSIPLARRRSRLVTARVQQCCAGGLTSLPAQPSAALPRDPSPAYDDPIMSPALSPGSTGWRPGACLVQAGDRDNRLSFTERYASSLLGCRSAPFVWYSVQTTSEIITHWPARCPLAAVFYCWRSSFRCGWCSTMEQSATWYRREWHTVTVRRELKTFLFRQSYHIPLFYFSFFALWSFRFFT